ncbi:hypothetical protein KQX54_018277 [Cotesia glomerata]|uniref:Uncharacterized protein n=1 Tax=Cotesia glomerata TaxID=32391 RepID=A0AAV7I7M1_COTGL|nr:hypothetical protein KQX54_018277 [Cotesia glomerata]
MRRRRPRSSGNFGFKVGWRGKQVNVVSDGGLEWGKLGRHHLGSLITLRRSFIDSTSIKIAATSRSVVDRFEIANTREETLRLRSAHRNAVLWLSSYKILICMSTMEVLTKHPLSSELSRGMPRMHEKKHIEDKKILLHLRCCTRQQKSRLSAICEPIVRTSSANKDKEKERTWTTGRNTDQHM